MNDHSTNGSGHAEPISADIDAASRRLMTALDALESAVERRREADRDENELAVRIQALGADRCRRDLMNHINVTINGRQYRMACEEGQEVQLLKLAESLESRIGTLRGKFGEIGDARLIVMAALTVCDEMLDAAQRIRGLEQELESLRNVRTVAAERARATQAAVANALNSAADRIEKTTQVLNRTIGGGVAIG